MKTQDALSPKQTQALAHLLEAETISEAASEAGVSRTTLYKWLKDPRFKAELDLARREELRARLATLTSMLPKALFALEGLLEAADPRVRLRAATEVVRASQALAQALASETPVAWGGGELFGDGAEGALPAGGADLAQVARTSVGRLLEGSLSPHAAQMLPSYLRLLERLEEAGNGRRSPRSPALSEEEEAFERAFDEADPKELAEFLTLPLRFDPGEDQEMIEYQETIREICRQAPGNEERREAVARKEREAEARAAEAAREAQEAQEAQEAWDSVMRRPPAGEDE